MARETNETNNLSNFKSSFLRKYVKLGYHHMISNAFVLVLIPLFSMNITTKHISIYSIQNIAQVCLEIVKNDIIRVYLFTGSLILLGFIYLESRPRKVYLLNFACYKPNSALKAPTERFMDLSTKQGVFTEKNLNFQKKIIDKSGLGQETYLSKIFNQFPTNTCMATSEEEAKEFMFGAIDELLAKTCVETKDIGILIVNCSLFNPTPSLSAMIINHYNLKDNILSFNLTGMGCSASLISIDLAKHLLQVHVDTYALLLSIETMSHKNWYLGNDRSMLVSNCLFRTGTTATLLSNKPSDRNRSKYQLIHAIRTHKGAEDKGYSCIYRREDDNMRTGVSLSKDLMAVAGKALKTNITTLGPLVLPMSEKLLFFATLVANKGFQMKIKPYIPDFKLAFEHFCIHPGGKAVLDEVEKNLELSELDMEPSRMTLYRFGNTSSSALWYELAYMEAKGKIKNGHRIWQIAFGSGFKCTSVVWRSLRTVDPAMEKNPWTDEINKFPVHVLE